MKCLIIYGNCTYDLKLRNCTDDLKLQIPMYNFADRPFSVYRPKLCNNISYSARSSKDTKSFKKET